MIIIEDLDAIDVVVPISEDVAYLVATPAATTMTVSITMKEKVVGTLAAGVSVTFADVNPDTITRTKGSWIDDGFDVGMILTVTGTVSNDGSYTIDTLTDTVITLIGGDALTNETGSATIVGNIAAADWFVHETVVASSHSYKALEVSPTALRFIRASGTGTCRFWVRT